MSDELRRPPFNIGAVDEARALAARADALHREADAIVVPWREVLFMGETPEGRPVLLARLVVHEAQSPEVERAAALRRVACDLDQRADRLVPVEYRQ